MSRPIYRHSKPAVKNIGLLGGMSWESSDLYYQIVNKAVQKALGGVHSAPCIMYSYDFEEIEKLQSEGKWDEAGALLAKTSKGLESIGAQCIVLCTNTMHKLAGFITDAVEIPLLHIADFTGEAIVDEGVDTIGLLGTRFTMTEEFYRKRLEDQYGLRVLIPEGNDIDIVHNIIYEELVKGIVTEESRAQYVQVINRLVRRGARGVILGCTEIGILIKQEDIENAKLYDTTELHAEGAAKWALKVE
ncbi:aspartate racemase [Geopyxis carbonaria]|nr:aspartate racemase [Geopyxis carbonaria]